MKDKDLKIAKCHALYSKKCKEEILKKIALHYKKEEQKVIWEKVQKQYETFLKDWRTDLGGKRNFHNSTGGTYDCIALMSYYVVCKNDICLKEIEEMEENLVLPSFKNIKFVNCNKPFWKKLMYKAFTSAKKKCDKWNDYKMIVAPYQKDQPICYEFTSCPVAEFARKNHLEEGYACFM